MNGALYFNELKSNAKTISSYAFGMLFYLWLFIWIYPSFAGSQALNNLLQQMPQGLMKVLGYTVGVTHIGDFLGGEFYSLLYLIIMGIYTIFVATKLVAHMVDTGSMAYLLASPVSRTKIAITQAAVLISGVLVIGLVSTVGALLGVHWFVHHPEMNDTHFVQMNIVGVLLFCVVSGYCFLFSCLVREERTALGLSALVTIVFYGLHTVGELTTKFDWMNHLTLFNVFDPQNLIHGRGHFVADSISLAVSTVVLFGIAIAGFRRRQLPL